MSAAPGAWQFWVDRGGTFTDVVAIDPSGQSHTAKLLSDNPARYRDAAVEGIRRMLDRALEPGRVASIKMGTTVATNALLERRGEPTALVITAGLTDAIRIGSQQRPEIFALDIVLPEMLYCEVVAAHERCAADGEIVVPLDEARLRQDLEAVRARGIDSLAIVLLHGYRCIDHEQRAMQIARDIGFKQVSASHEVSPLIKLVPRGETTLVDAYLSPVLKRYVESVAAGLGEIAGDAELLFMQSHGGLAAAERFRGKDSILSGPAGGVVGMARTAAKAGFTRVIGFDMGGTSTDVALYDGAFERTQAAVIAGVRITSPMMRIHTVAAGGGSILRYSQQRLQAGPESAGANPGPACYRNHGPLTITDANVLLGRIRPEYFPHVFGPRGDEPLDSAIVRQKFEALAIEIEAQTALPTRPEDVAAGGLRIAVERMANAIKQISVRQGHDLRDFALSCFGGAGGQHACQVADSLGIENVLIHPLAGVLSAYGMGLADVGIIKQKTIERELGDRSLAEILALARTLESDARGELETQRVGIARTRQALRLRLKPRGSDSSLLVECGADASARSLEAAFRALYRMQYGFEEAGGAIVVDSLELELIGEVDVPALQYSPDSSETATPLGRRRAWFDGQWLDAPVYRRAALGTAATVPGPAIIVEDNATTVVEPGWVARTDDLGNLLMTRLESARARRRRSARGPADPVLLEVFNNLFMHAAEQMGNVLENTAHSVNIKERKDFSCAIFEANGDLIANAPHLPVHLGSMGESVRHVLRARGDTLSPGDVFVTNAPYNGGTHLPDITVVTPYFDDAGLQFMLASRAHHADVGGLTPGSMPPKSASIFEEGVVIDDLKLVADGRFLVSEIVALLRSGPYPARNPAQNVADLKAQIAANTRGIAELRRIVERFGLETVHAYMRHIKHNAELCVRRAIDKLEDGEWRLELDNGDWLAVSVRINRSAQTATVDFSGTSRTSRGNFNAPSAIARSAVLYVFRTIVEENIPLNAGCMVPIRLRLPEDSLVNPTYPAAVVGGNVETSQCITDALLAALGLVASSQGTMNNFTFGNDRYQYYETLCGGAGATRRADGASAVHTHMTNSMLTDPEIIEWRYPVRLRRFSVRQGSGGAGRHRGGDGIVRELEFLEPMHAAILSNRREIAPFGIAGGSDGAVGRNCVVRADGELMPLAGVAETDMRAGDRFVIETPGGGGFGSPTG